MGCKHLGRLAYSEGERSCRWGGVAQFLGQKSYQILGPKSNQILVKLLAWISERKFKKIEKSIEKNIENGARFATEIQSKNYYQKMVTVSGSICKSYSNVNMSTIFW